MPDFRMGWRKDQPDHRDRLFGTPQFVDTCNLPTSVSLVEHCPPVYDQGQLGSCSANAVAAAFEFDAMKQGISVFTPSRLFIYYWERALEGTTATDSGARLRDGIKVLNSRGVCPESEWGYDVAQFATEPSAQAQADARRDRAVKYARVAQQLTQMKAVLAGGYPIVFGISVYESFMQASNGVIPMPGTSESCIGGHALVCVGFDDASQRFAFRNSWSASYGNGGYGTIPYAYLTDASLASDFWVVQVVQES